MSLQGSPSSHSPSSSSSPSPQSRYCAQAQAQEDKSGASDNDAFSQDDLSEYDVDPSPLSSPERGVTRGRLAKQLRGKVKRLKIELPPSVIRSYLDDGTRSLDELRDVKSLRSVTDRAAVIVRACKASPVQAFYYCVDYPDGTPADFLDLKRRANLAFHLEGMRIMHMLTEEDRKKLSDTPLADVLAEYRKRDTRLMVLTELKRHVSETEGMEILQDASTQGRISLGGEECSIATKLLDFWKERGNTAVRKDRLKAAFEKHGMQLRDECPFCNAYVDGKVDAELDDVIGISVVASRLRGRRKDIFRYLPACEESLRKCLHHQDLSLMDAVRQAMLATRPIDRLPVQGTPTIASLLAHALRPSHYLPFSVMILRKEITIHTS